MAVYTDRRFEPEKWREAIEKDGVGDWHHVKIAADMAAPQPQPGDIRSHYYVQAIPRKILIDRNGMIVKTWVGVSRQYEEEFASLLSNALQDKVKETNK